MIEKLREALRRLVDTIEATGGIVLDDDGNYVPEADEDWVDLGEAYLAACKAIRIRPLVDGERSEASQIPINSDSVVDAALAIRCLISAIESTGGLHYDGTCFVPEGDREWADLGGAYLAACEALESAPLVDGRRGIASSDVSRLVTVPHARCWRSKACVEHAHDPRVPSCKRRRRSGDR